MTLTVLSVAYPLAPVGQDAVGGAEQMLSEAFIDNPASARVSEKTGYQRIGSRPVPRGQFGEVEEVMFRLTPQALLRPDEPLLVEGLEPLRRYLGLDGSSGNTAEAS